MIFHEFLQSCTCLNEDRTIVDGTWNTFCLSKPQSSTHRKSKQCITKTNLVSHFTSTFLLPTISYKVAMQFMLVKPSQESLYCRH